MQKCPPITNYFSSVFVLIYFSQGIRTYVLYLMVEGLCSNKFIICYSIFSTCSPHIALQTQILVSYNLSNLTKTSNQEDNSS